MIESIVDDFKFRLAMMEKYLIYIQERNHYFETPDIAEKLSEKNVKGLKELNTLLEIKINDFHKSIEKHKMSKKSDFYFEVKDSYDQIKDTILDIFKMISNLLEEIKIDSMCKIINENLGIKVKDRESEEEEKGKMHNEEPLDIYDKKIDFLISDYISSQKVDHLKINILKACNWAEDYYNRNKISEEKLADFKAKYDSLYEEYKNHLSQCEEHKGKPSNEEDTNKLEKHEELSKELKVVDDDTINEIKSNIEMILSKKKQTKEFSSLLDKILDIIEVFDPTIHFKLMDTLEVELKRLCGSFAKKKYNEQELEELKDAIIDFLYLIKDKHPFSNPEWKNNFDVFYRVMDFMKVNHLKPSKKLIKMYEQSEITMKLNEIPSYEKLYEAFYMPKESYDRMMKRYTSLPPFVYYFNPNIDLQIWTDNEFGCWYRIGLLNHSYEPIGV